MTTEELEKHLEIEHSSEENSKEELSQNTENKRSTESSCISNKSRTNDVDDEKRRLQSAQRKSNVMLK